MQSGRMMVMAAVALATATDLVAQSAAPRGARGPRGEAAVRSDLSVLAADSMGGRFTGTAAEAAAARYLSRRLAEVGAKPGLPGWLQEFSIAADVPGVKDIPEASRPSRGTNVVATIAGRDPAVRDEFVVVGAHYDHLGHGEARSSALGEPGQVFNGADDNASGTVALLEIARLLAAAPPRRSVVVIAFSGEELGLLGSAAYVRNPVVPLDRTVGMVNLDMVGRLRNDRLLVFGSETATEFPALLDSLNRTARFDLHYSGDGFGRSDHQSFYLAKKPVLHLFTDLHEDYHRPGDDWDKINVPGIVRVAEFGAAAVRAMADRTAPLSFVFKAPPPPAPVTAGQPAAGGRASLGTIPDMASGGPGVRISGVSPGSAGEKAGLVEGDVIIRIGTFEITDLQAMSDALRAHRPGDTVMVTYRRGTATDSVSVVLGRRGG